MEREKRIELVDVSIGCYHAVDHVSDDRVQISKQLNWYLLSDFKVVQDHFEIARKNLTFIKDRLKEANEELFLVKTMIADVSLF